MFATHSPRHSTVMACVLAAALLGPGAALAQQQKFERSKVHVNVGLPVQQEVAPSFAIDMALHSDSRLQGAIVPLGQDTRVQGKHSSIQATTEGLRATFGTQLQQQTADGALELGKLTVQGQSAAPAGGGGDGGDIIVFDIVDSVADSAAAGSTCCRGGGADVIVFDIIDSVVDSPSALLEIRFEPASETEQLMGRPATLFNTPGPGEPLVATLPQLAPGEELDLVLEVVRPGGSRTLIPVRIKHNL